MGERPGLDEAVDMRRHVMGTHLSVPASLDYRGARTAPVPEHGITRDHIIERIAAALGSGAPMRGVVGRATEQSWEPGPDRPTPYSGDRYPYWHGHLLYRCAIAVLPPGELADMLRAAYDAGREQGRADRG